MKIQRDNFQTYDKRKKNHDVHMHTDNLIAKVNQIRSHCPTSKIVVSPILPTAVKILNEKACMFDRFLCSVRRSFDIIAFKFNSFCGQDGQLMDMYRCYSNRSDKIHIGRLGIIRLTSILVNAISKIEEALPPSYEVDKPDIMIMNKLADMIVTNIREKKSNLFYYNFYFYHSFFYLYIYIAFSPSLSLWSTFIN